MIRIIKADGEEKQFLAEVEKRAGQVNADVEKTVRAILADVKENGDAAVKSYTAKFDCPNAQYYRVPAARERTRPRWSVRTRRHGCVPFLRADERNPGENSRR